jgi:hypothetical protein
MPEPEPGPQTPLGNQGEVMDRVTEALRAGAAGNRQHLFEARESMQELTKIVARGRWEALVPVCEAADELLNKIIRYGSVEQKEAIPIARGLASAIASMLQLQPPMARTEDTAPYSPPGCGGEETEHIEVTASALQIINESRLGEILIRMGLLDGDQLDRALVLQKVTKKKLGEVLVAMEAISLASLDKALDLQRQATMHFIAPGDQPPVAPGFPAEPQPEPPVGPGGELRLRLGDDQ